MMIQAIDMSSRSFDLNSIVESISGGNYTSVAILSKLVLCLCYLFQSEGSTRDVFYPSSIWVAKI